MKISCNTIVDRRDHGNDDETVKVLLCAKPFKIVRIFISSFFPCLHKIVLEIHILYELKN